MDVLGETCEDERKFKNFIRSVPSALQERGTNNSKSERDTEISRNEHRWGNDPSCHRMGCSCPIIHDQHRQSSDGDFSRSTENMAISTFDPVGELDIDFSGNRGGNANSNKCGVENRAPENYKDLVRNVANRRQEHQKTNISDTTESRFSELSFLSSGSEWEFGGEPRALGFRKLRRNEHMVSPSITETRATNRNLCNNDIYTTRETTLQELPNEREPQHTQDLPLLLELLNSKYPYRKEANKNILDDREIRLFNKMYGITDFRLMFVTYDDSVFWLEGPDGVIYFWSRIDDSMICGGGNLKEALTNYLFHRENLCYVDEFTRELIPINTYDKEAEEWTKSPEKYFKKIDVTEILQKHKSEMGGRKK